MKTKVAIKFGNVTPFGGIFYIMDEFSHLGIDKLIDRVLGLHCSTCKMAKNGKKMVFEYLFPKAVSFIMENITSCFLRDFRNIKLTAFNFLIQ